MFAGKLQRTGWYFLCWTALGLYMSSQGVAQRAVTHDPTPWWHHLVSWMVGVYVWFLLTPLALWLGRRFPIQRDRWLLTAGWQMLLSIALALLQLGCESVIVFRLGLFPIFLTSYSATFAFLLVIGFHGSVLTYWAIIGIQYAAGWYRQYQERKQEALRLQLRSSELQTQLVEARLGTLKMQLQPHFLFNTLNTIMVLVRQQKSSEAEKMLGLLSDLLRSVLEDVEAQEVSLQRELEYVRLYLSIEQVRFQDRLRLEFVTPPEYFDVPVPQMILQPIVENAIRHGINQRSAPGLIQIRVEGAIDKVKITIENDGPKSDSTVATPRHGIGLSNTRARLQQLYGDAAVLTLQHRTAGGAIATIMLPYRPAFETETTGIHALHSISR